MKTQFGRSMIEMLGVLAIIAVLSIGGLLGYRRAVNSHHANTILNDVNRFAFVILEKSGLPLGEEIPKGDFVESGLYDLEGYQDIEPEQFSITVFDVPKGVCKSLLPKAVVEYDIRVNEAGSDEGTLYDLFHTDLCHDSNDIVLYFGNTDDLFDFPECGRLPKCTKYSSDCKCIECEEGYQLSKDNSSDPDGQYCVANACQSTGDPCTSNDDCCKSTDFCSFERATGCSDVNATEYMGKMPNVTYGKCTSVADFGTGTGDYTKTVTVNGTAIKFVRGQNTMKWWSARNWCQRFKRLDGANMEIPSAADLGCGYFPTNSTLGYCTQSGGSGRPGRSGSALAFLQSDPDPMWTSTYHWLSDNSGSTPSCTAYRVYFYDSSIDHGYRSNLYYTALCW